MKKNLSISPIYSQSKVSQSRSFINGFSILNFLIECFSKEVSFFYLQNINSTNIFCFCIINEKLQFLEIKNLIQKHVSFSLFGRVPIHLTIIPEFLEFNKPEQIMLELEQVVLEAIFQNKVQKLLNLIIRFIKTTRKQLFIQNSLTIIFFKLKLQKNQGISIILKGRLNGGLRSKKKVFFKGKTKGLRSFSAASAVVTTSGLINCSVFVYFK